MLTDYEMSAETENDIKRMIAPSFPPMTFIVEGDFRKKCSQCGSSLKRKMFFKIIGCESPECSNFWRNNNTTMKLIKKGKPETIWRGSCRKCHAEFEDSETNVRKGNVSSCPREHYSFAHRDCPECGAKAGFAVILYPVND